MARMAYSQRKRQQLGRQAHDRYQDARRNLHVTTATAADIRRSKAWREFRKWYRINHPLCCDPFKVHHGRPVQMQDVHHVKPCGEYPDLAFDERNCRALCRGCHAKIEAMERQGQATDGLFG